jgi:hypothetical protein
MGSGKIFGIALAAAVAGGAIGAAGYALISPEKTKEVQVQVLVTPSPTPSLSPSPSESPEVGGTSNQSDDTAIFAAVKTYDGSSGNLSTPKVVGSFAVTTQSRGATYFLKKTNGTWKVISAGNGQSTQELKSLGIPSSLYQ